MEPQITDRLELAQGDITQQELEAIGNAAHSRLVPAAALAQAIQETLTRRDAPKRLDNDALVRRAVCKLL